MNLTIAILAVGVAVVVTSVIAYRAGRKARKQPWLSVPDAYPGLKVTVSAEELERCGD